MKPQESSLNRADWIDIAKGIAICLVVVGHAWRGLFSAGQLSDAIFIAVDERIYAFHMPVFFLLSGVFYISVVDRLSARKYINRLFLKMFWPMVLWTYLFFFVKLAAGTLANNPVSFAEFPAVPIPGQLHLWFLWALLIISVLLLPLRFCLNDGHLNPWVLWGLGGVIIILANMPMPFALHYWTSNALQYLPFFYLGVVLSHENAFDRLSRNAGLIAAGVFISMIAVWPLIKDAGIAWPASFVVTLCFLVAIAKLSEKYAFWGKGLALNLGKATFAIYVAHTIFSATMREVLFVASVNNVVMHMLVGTLIGIIGPLIFVKIAKLTKTRAFFGV